MPSLERYQASEVTLLGDANAAGGVTFAFTERTGGVSAAPYASLNLGASCGDDPAAVAENRRRALAALGAGELLPRLVNPRQVHGSNVVVVRSQDPSEVARAQEEAAAGADAVVCTAPDVPVLLCFADCVPVVLCSPRGFAVVHSGWRGTIARIAAVAARTLMEEAHCGPQDLTAYVGPHIAGCDYEVSEELIERFAGEFGGIIECTPRHLDLAVALETTFAEVGIAQENVVVCQDSTATNTNRFFSYRAEGGSCGRHGAIALIHSDPSRRPHLEEASLG